MIPANPAQADQLTRFVFDDLPGRGLHVRLQDVWQHRGHHKKLPARHNAML